MVRNLISPRKLDIVFLSEIRCGHVKVSQLAKSLNFVDCYSLSHQGNGEGACILWNDNILLSVGSSSISYIDTNITLKNISLRFTGFYGQD